MTEPTGYLSAGNARATIAAYLDDAGCPGAQFIITERPGAVDVHVAGAPVGVLAQVQAKLEAIAWTCVTVRVVSR